MSIRIAAFLCIGAVTLLCGCRDSKPAQILNPQNVMAGGRTDRTDPSAPKTIESRELVRFDAGFYRYGGYLYAEDRRYDFQMTRDENENFTITEGYGDEALTCETDADFAARLEQLIRDEDLISLNGKWTQTAGLAPECGPVHLDAEYASGEQLNFHMDGSLNDSWTEAVLELFADEFAAHGIRDLFAAPEESAVTRFSLEYTDGDIRQCFSETYVAVTEEEKNRSLEDVATNGMNKEERIKKIYSEPWDRSDPEWEGDMIMADVTEKHYADLKEIIDDSDLARYQNGQIFPFDFDYENTPQYYEFYVEFESGNIISGFSDDPEECEKFRPTAERFAQYFDAYMAENAE